MPPDSHDLVLTTAAAVALYKLWKSRRAG